MAANQSVKATELIRASATSAAVADSCLTVMATAFVLHADHVTVTYTQTKGQANLTGGRKILFTSQNGGWRTYS